MLNLQLNRNPVNWRPFREVFLVKVVRFCLQVIYIKTQEAGVPGACGTWEGKG